MRNALNVIAATLIIPSALAAQTVTLPTIRTGKALEVAMLNRFVDAVRKDSDSLGIWTRYPKWTKDSLSCDLTRLALAAFNKAEVAALNDSSEVKRTPSKTIRFEKLYQEHSRGSARSATARALADVVEKAPASCPTTEPPSEADVRNIIEHYLEAETNVERRGRLDSLGRSALANVIQTKLRARRWFPVRTHDQAMAFWKQSSNSSLNVGAVSGSSEDGATFTEITSRFLHPLRVSISAVLAAVKDSAKSSPPTPAAGASTSRLVGSIAVVDSSSKSTITRFLNGGGLFNVAVAFPWLHLGTSSGAVDFVGLLSSRVGGTLPVLGATAQDTTMLYDVGTELFFKSTDRIDGIGFFMQSRVAVAGGSRRFMTLIGDPMQKWTGYQTMSLGLTIDDKYLITLSRTLAGPHSLQTGWQIGTTLARSAASPTSTP